MEKEKKFVINDRLFNIALGILLVFLSVVMAINVGYVGRTISFIPIALFGMVSYLLFVDMFINGVYLIIFGKKLVFNKKVRILGLILIGLALLVLTTLIARSKMDETLGLISNQDNKVKNFFLAYQDVYKTITGGWYRQSYIEIVNEFKFGGGILGYFLTGVLVPFISLTGTYAVSITVLVFGLLFFFLPEIVLLVKTQLNKSSENRSARRSLPKEERPMIAQRPVKSNFRVSSSSNKRVNNIDIISDASNLDTPESNNNIVSSVNEYNQPNSGLQLQPNNLPFNPTFQKAVFRTSEDVPLEDNNTPKQVEEPIRPTPVFSTFSENPAPSVQAPVQNEQPVNPNAFENRVVEQPAPFEQPSRINKQMSIFEEENVSDYDESLVKMQPNYTEPVAVKREEQNKVEPKPRKERLNFIPPSIDLLNDYETTESSDINDQVAEERKEAINRTFEDFRVGARCVSYTVGPSVTRFNIEYDSNVSVNQVKRYVDDISRRLGGVSARFEQIVAGETYSGLEIPNAKTTTVQFKDIMKALPNEPKHCLAVGFGKNISGKIIQADFNEFPHLLVAGSTGSGKSVFVHSVIMPLIMRNSPDDLKMVLIDPKQVEMNLYEDMPHLLTPIINDPKRAKAVLDKLCDEMDYRYSLFKIARVLNMKDYNKWADTQGKDRLPYIIVVFDEYADCVDMCKDISQPVVRIAQKARAAGIHMLIATQRPSVNVVTGTIKANLPTHCALMTSNAQDSMTILNEGGAEKLLGKGDMLVQSPLVSRVGCVRLQSSYVTDVEINRVVDYLKENYPVNYDPEYDTLEEEAKEMAQQVSIPSIGGDALSDEEAKYQAIKEWTMAQDYVSMSRIQREFSMGFNRAGKIFQRLQQDGIVAMKPDTASSSKGCRVLVHDKFVGEEPTEDVLDEEIINTGE